MRGLVGLALGDAVQSEDHLPLAKTLQFRQGLVPMKLTEGVRKYAAEQRLAEEEAQKKGMEEKSKEFSEKGVEF